MSPEELNALVAGRDMKKAENVDDVLRRVCQIYIEKTASCSFQADVKSKVVSWATSRGFLDIDTIRAYMAQNRSFQLDKIFLATLAFAVMTIDRLKSTGATADSDSGSEGENAGPRTAGAFRKQHQAQKAGASCVIS